MKYRKKPVVIDAIQLTRRNCQEVENFTQGAAHDFTIEKLPNGKFYCYIRTLEGVMRADEGDYIIKGIAGEFYPCKSDIFKATYDDAVENEIIREPIKPKAPINAQLENSYSYHAPKGDQTERYEALRGKAKELAHMIDELCPSSREKALAQTNLEQTVMWANKSIACNE